MPTPPGPLTRTNYLNWPPGPYQAEADPDSPSFDPSNVLPAAGFPSDGTAAVDAEQYQRPLERLHGMGMHAAGVAFGMQIACKIGQPNVMILPGLGLDGGGRHVFLAEGGSAEIGPNANVPGTPPDPAPVSAAGVTLPTAGYTGKQLVVVQWWETWDSAAYAADPNVNQYNDTPWLQLLPEASYDPDVHIILGNVTLTFDGLSNVTAASYGDTGGLQRTSVSLPAQSLQLKRAITTAAPGADSATWGEVRAREAGGIEIAVANNSDQVNVLSDAGGSFSSFGVGANRAVVGDLGNPGITLNGAEATVVVGASGNYGAVRVYDGSNHLAVALVGDTAHAIVGGNTLAGKVRMLNASATDTMSLNGDTGSAVVQRIKPFANNLIDVDSRYFHIHGWDLALDGRSGKNNRALVDWGNKLIINYAGDYGNGVEINSALQVDNNVSLGGVLSAQGVPLMGNPARKVSFVQLFAGTAAFGGTTPTRAYAEVQLPAHTQFTAICMMSIINSTVAFDYDNGISAEVWMVDGVKQPSVFYNDGQWGSAGDDNNARPPIVSGKGKIITFRLTSLGPDLVTMGYGIVFYE